MRFALEKRENLRPWLTAMWAVAAAFGAYFCMYAFRKPYTAATTADFDGLALGGIDYKNLLIAAQTLGYLTSKFVGIKVVAELPRSRRAAGVVVLIAAAQATLLLLGATPAPWNFPLMFFNGLALGMVFGLVLGFLEGRQLSEALVAGLCASFILADGVMKTLGKSLLDDFDVSAFWMPAAAGGLFLPLTLLFAWMLSRIAPPTAVDEAARSERPPMTPADQRAFVSRFAMGLSAIVFVYVLLTVMRGVRADLAPEIWKSLGVETTPGIFTTSELWVAAGVVAVNGASFLISDNRRAFFASLAVCGAGFSLLLVAWAMYSQGSIGAFPLMVSLGLGLYLPYVAVHTTVFERLIAMTRQRGNVGFLMYVVDACGYAFLVMAMLIEGMPIVKENLLIVFAGLCIVASVLSIVGLSFCAWYFRGVTAAPAVSVANQGA
jgi:hypothetical protein